MANEFKVKKGLIVQGSGSVGDNTILDVQGNQGQLFSITDSLSGSLFSVSDISGIPILEVFSDDTVKIGTFGSEGIIVNGSNVTASANISASGFLRAQNITASSNISASGTITANYFTGTLTAPTAPTSLALSIVDDTINVTFSASVTTEISHYEIHASDNGGTYGLISTITPDDFSSSMSIIDDTFILSGTQAYRVFAIKNGVFSSALTDSISFSAGTLNVANMAVVPTLNTFQIKWDPPSLGSRFVTAYNVTKHEHAVQASLSEASATQIYSGLNTSFDYPVNGIDNNN